MLFNSHSPLWFLGIDSLLLALFFLITLLIGRYAWKISQLSGTSSHKRWATGFLVISIAYLVNAATNFTLWLDLNGAWGQSPAFNMIEATLFYRLGLFTHITLFLIGYLLLTLATIHCEDRQVRWLTIILTLLLAGASMFQIVIFELALVIFIGFIIANLNAGKKRNPWVIAGFAVLLLAQFSYMFIDTWGVSYALGHLLEFLGYVLLAISFEMIMKK